jgi:signal transduction histidine kinase
LDDLLAQLVERAQDVMSAQSRLRGLLRATLVIAGDLELPVVLHHVVEAACELVGARYGALGVIGVGGGLEQFVHVGIDVQTADRIGLLPEGKGLLGAVIADPRPIRLPVLADDPRAVGFPAHHPPMTSFLGVPIKIRDVVFGNLYLTESDHGEFTEEDEQLATSLAASAGTAIDNARQYAAAERRQEWSDASAEITRILFSAHGEQPLAAIALRAHRIAAADVVTVVLPTGDPGRLMVEVAAGLQSEAFTGMSYHSAQTIAGQAIASGQPVVLADVAAQHDYLVHLSEVLDVGPVIALPLVGYNKPRGALIVARLRGRQPFTDDEVLMATTFANHAAVALELADARLDQQRMALLEDRDRIARDLHDHVIQRLFATGLTAQSLARSSSAVDARRLTEMVEHIDGTIRQIRTSIFQLRGTFAPGASAVRTAVLAIVGELAPELGFTPELQFVGPVDTATSADLVDDVTAVVREALTNIVRHARATAASVVVEADTQQLCVQVADNGRGYTPSGRSSGLDNLRDRAERRGGGFDITSDGGTQVRWTIPIR